MTKDYVVQVKIRNGPLVHAMRRKGFLRVVDFAEACGCNSGAIYPYLSLSKSAVTNTTGQWRSMVLKMAEVLGCMPGDLFPPQHVYLPLEKSTGEFEISLDEIEQLSGHDGGPDLLLAVKEQIEKLPQREQQVLTARYGLDGDAPGTLEDVGELFGVGKEQVRQIEGRAIRRIRSRIGKEDDFQKRIESMEAT